MTVIFCLSNQPADDSSSLSDGFISSTIGNVYKVFNKNISSEDLEEIKVKYTHPVRKMAHFTIYMILGILVTLLVREYNISFYKCILISLLVCLLYSISDEIHQTFVTGRSGEVRDVLIDTCGSFIGIFVFNKLFKKKV
jgi:VanZ family protein